MNPVSTRYKNEQILLELTDLTSLCFALKKSGRTRKKMDEEKKVEDAANSKLLFTIQCCSSGRNISNYKYKPPRCSQQETILMIFSTDISKNT